ncbi:hypothetical protein J3F84DRAFT_367192 [Trichoderma pleuroticola]
MQQMLAQRATLAPEHDEALHHSYTPTISPRQTSLQGAQQTKANPGPSSHPLPVKRMSHDGGVGSRGASDGEVVERARSGKPCMGGKEGKRAPLRDTWPTRPGIHEELTSNLASNLYDDGNADGEDGKGGQGQKHGATEGNGKKNASLWTWATWF